MKINIEEFKNKYLDLKKPTLVEFWSSWCPACQTMKPVLEEIKSEYDDKINIVDVNIDMTPDFIEEFTIRGVPTFILFEEGKEIKREVGARTKENIYKMIKDFV
jgi:thioredoxin 1